MCDDRPSGVAGDYQNYCGQEHTGAHVIMSEDDLRKLQFRLHQNGEGQYRFLVEWPSGQMVHSYDVPCCTVIPSRQA